jgi:hypothetical protein
MIFSIFENRPKDEFLKKTDDFTKLRVNLAKLNPNMIRSYYANLYLLVKIITPKYIRDIFPLMILWI